MRLLITGIHGFIGGSVGRYARLAGHDVLGVGLSAQKPDGWTAPYRQLDVAFSDLAGLLRDFRPDALLHAAGTASVGGSYAAPLDDLRTAVLTWANTLDGVRRSGLSPVVVFPSSAAVYGNPARLPVAEDAPVCPISPYGFHKAICELLAQEFTSCYGLNILVARLFSVYGPLQKRLLLWELCSQALEPGSDIVLHGTGKETRDYLHVDDLAHILLEVSLQLPKGLTILNVGSGQAMQTEALARLVADTVGTGKAVRILGQSRPGDPPHWQADVSHLLSLSSWTPRPVADGLQQCLDAWREP